MNDKYMQRRRSEDEATTQLKVGGLVGKSLADYAGEAEGKVGV